MRNRKIKCEIVKILAWGYEKAIMTIKINDEQISTHISRKLYYELKSQGVPTGQALRYQNDKRRTNKKI